MVTCWPAETDVTLVILLTTVSPLLSLYFQLSPAVDGNGTDAEEVTEVEPPELPPELEADGEVPELAGDFAPDAFDPDPLDGPHPVRTRPAAAASTAIVPAGLRKSCR